LVTPTVNTKRGLILLFVLSISLATFGQTKARKAVPPLSHRLQVLLRLNLAEVQFKVSCAKTADHIDNQHCVDQMLRELQDTYRKFSLAEIPVPENYQRTQTVMIFKEEVLMDEDTVSVAVYETENNDELHSDSRSRLILSNDLTKLLGGYVETLREPPNKEGENPR
jgi:hypothetical protein